MVKVTLDEPSEQEHVNIKGTDIKYVIYLVIFLMFVSVFRPS